MLIFLFSTSVCNLNYKHWKRLANELHENCELDVAQRHVIGVFFQAMDNNIQISWWFAKTIQSSGRNETRISN